MSLPLVLHPDGLVAVAAHRGVAAGEEQLGGGHVRRPWQSRRRRRRAGQAAGAGLPGRVTQTDQVSQRADTRPNGSRSGVRVVPAPTSQAKPKPLVGEIGLK
jgi:hypothetical protein